jgi:hypothetical protein
VIRRDDVALAVAVEISQRDGDLDAATGGLVTTAAF